MQTSLALETHVFKRDTIQLIHMYNYTCSLGTFDVQRADTDLHNEYVATTCHFAQGSEAKGCKIEAKPLQEYNNGSFCKLVAPRNLEDQATVIFTLPNGTYTILVYDEEDNALASSNPASKSTISLLTSAQVTECTVHDGSSPSSIHGKNTICELNTPP